MDAPVESRRQDEILPHLAAEPQLIGRAA